MWNRQKLNSKKLPINLKLRNAFLLCFFGLLFATTARAQIIFPPSGMEFRSTPKFNPEFIEKNKISEIRSRVETKRDGDRIRNSNSSEVYHFNQNGTTRMIAHINGAMRDTSITIFEYTGGRLNCEVKNDAAGMYSYCYEYDKDDRLASLKYGRAKRESGITASLHFEPVSEITTERYSYAKVENQLHATLHNASGRPYIKETRYYDDHGYLVKYLKTYVIGSSRHEENYTYNENGWLATKTVNHGANTYTLIFTYDTIGNLQEEQKIEDGKTMYRKEYVYDPKTMLLTAELKREDENEIIIITTYTYKYNS